MSYKRPTPGELVAIYRLEFYKNQSKWKLSNDRKLRKEGSKQKLNETYRVEDEEPPEVEPLEPLNDAFLETDSDENKEERKPEPLPSLRRWKNTILDIKVADDDWEIKPRGWEAPVEQVRSYEEEWGEGECCGEDMQCAEEVYSSELCMSNSQRSRLPVFARWPALNEHTAPPPDRNMLQKLVQNLGARQKGQRQNVAEMLRQQIEKNGGPIGQNVGQMGQNNRHMGQNIEQVGQHFRQNKGQNTGQFGQNFGQNILQHMEHNDQSVRQNVIQDMMQNVGYIETKDEKTLMQNMGQNVEFLGRKQPQSLRQIFESSLKRELRSPKMMELEQMEWEPERDCCGLQGGAMGGDDVDGGCKGGLGDACVAGAVAALAEAEGWLTGELKSFYLQPALGDSSLSSGDSAAFVRGAHARPHSSELDLTDTACQCANMSASKLANMSGAALRESLRAHAAAARRVLHELRLRERAFTQQPCAVSCDVTHESVPTRDVGGAGGGAGSGAGGGRGRGRRLHTK